MLKAMEEAVAITAKSGAKSATPIDTALAQTASASAVAAGVLQGDKAPQLKRSQVANQEIGTTTTSAIEKTGRAEVSARSLEALGPQPIAQAAAKSATPTDTALAQTASASAVAAGILQGDKAPQLKRSQVANQEIGTTTTSAIEKTGRTEVSARLSEALGPQPIAQADRQVEAGLASQLTVQAPTQSPSSNVTQLESSSALSATNNVALSVGADPSAGLGTDSSIQNNQRVSVGNLPQGIAARVNTHLAKGLGSGPTKISISLFPENYGQVDVEFVYSEEAGLKINLSSENAETTRLLQSNSSALRETLLGNSLASVSVDVNARGKQSESGERNETAARSANTSDDADTLNSSDGADSRIGGNKTSTNGLDTYV
jgi:hypothetical protein